jgi:hypothetical protein
MRKDKDCKTGFRVLPRIPWLFKIINREVKEANESKKSSHAFCPLIRLIRLSGFFFLLAT